MNQTQKVVYICVIAKRLKTLYENAEGYRPWKRGRETDTL